MADIGDVVTFNPKGPTKGPVPGIEYVVCSRGPEYVMATVKSQSGPSDGLCSL